MSGDRILLIIDPQNDFHCGGSLAVPGADEDAKRIAKLVNDKGDCFDEVIVTLDSHYMIHIAHGAFWVNDAGESPAPLTGILKADIESGKWKPKDPSLMEHVKNYCDALEHSDKQSLVIWPYHCLIGSPGHNVKDVILDSLHAWTGKYDKNIQYVMKGQNKLTEHYSALAADVPMPDDAGTMLNRPLMDKFEKASQIVVCGQAKSHCVNHTVRDIIRNLSNKSKASNIILLEDAMSSVTGFEAVSEQFISHCKGAGVQLGTCSSV
jgi:nicotinamidase-related amidase